jgi:hypothetical protein
MRTPQQIFFDEMPLRKRKELEQRDKRMAAVHEAGHATVGAAKGVCFGAWIHRNKSGEPDENTWLGHVQTMFGITMRNGKPVVVVGPCGALDSTFAVAGMVAEELDDDPNADFDWIMEFWESEWISPSPADLQSCSEDWHERSKAVQEAIDILREQKPLFDRIVAELLEHKIINEFQIAVLAAQLLVSRPTPALHRKKKTTRLAKPAKQRKSGNA